MAAPYIIITASDENFRPLLLSWLHSLQKLRPGFAFDIGVLDLGLSETTRQELLAAGVIVKTAQVDIEYPGRVAWENEMPYYRAMTARPFLPDYFPAYRAYMWVDADAWFQTAEAVAVMLPAAAESGELHIAAELDRDYRLYFESAAIWQVQANWYKNCFPQEIADKMALRPMLNVGVFTMPAACPLWQAWRELLAESLRRIPKITPAHFMLEQLCLNVAVYLGKQPARIMPADYNWLAMFTLPLYDKATQSYQRPTPPRAPLSILHLAGALKNTAVTITATDGEKLERVLTYAEEQTD